MKYSPATGTSGPSSDVKSFFFGLLRVAPGRNGKNKPKPPDAPDDSTPDYVGQHYRRDGLWAVASGIRRSLSEVAYGEGD